jgi:predicted nuclease of predicted toxin-antitoxin system
LTERPSVYLDECVDQRLAPALRDRGFSVLTASTAGTLGATDDNQLRFATVHDLVIISYNRRHFRRLHALHLERGEPHPGIVLVPATSLLPRLTVRAAMLLDWMTATGERHSQLFDWRDLQYHFTQGLRLPGYSDDELRLALGQPAR